MGMWDRTHAAVGGANRHGDNAKAAVPGKSTLVDDAAPARPSAFEGYEWEDIAPGEDIHDVNKIEAAAASESYAADDDELDAKDSAARPQHHGKKPHDGNGKKHDDGKKKPEGHDRGGGIHIITRAGLRHLRHAGPHGRHAAQVLYNNPNAYIVLKEGQTMPRGWQAKATILFPSYKDFKAAHEAGRIPRFVDAVVYDNEHWQQTPPDEKTHAVHYAKLFGELAQKLHLVFIAAPTQKWFAADARFADIIDLQLQGREIHTRAYANAVKHDVRLAHHLNPGIDVVAQISSNRNHLDPDHSGNIGAGIHKAERDIIQNAPYLDGFWGYLYQRNHKSVRAGQKILTDLADKSEDGVDI
jgi:hypothetical protein